MHAQILENVIKFKWGALPGKNIQQRVSYDSLNACKIACAHIRCMCMNSLSPSSVVDQREGIRNFLSNLIIRFTMDETLFRKENTFVNKLNLILVQVGGHTKRTAPLYLRG